MDNLRIWDAVKQPPASALKQILGGRLKGKTDISPQWRYKVMTEQFGVCGTGWKYEIKRVWSEPAPEGEVLAFAEVYLYTKRGDVWSDPIPGVGGSMLVDKETSGLHASDEAYKMAITDALSVAMKMLGVGADVYMGLWDGTKYVEKAKQIISEGHWCSEHGVVFFKKGAMRGYAHQIEGTNQWCNEGKKEESVTPDEEAKPLRVRPEVLQKTPGPQEFNTPLLTDSLKKVKRKDTTVKSYLKTMYKVDTTGTVVEVVARLKKEERDSFFKEISNRLQML